MPIQQPPRPELVGVADVLEEAVEAFIRVRRVAEADTTWKAVSKLGRLGFTPFVEARSKRKAMGVSPPALSGGGVSRTGLRSFR
jgi:hypothetical protein